MGRSIWGLQLKTIKGQILDYCKHERRSMDIAVKFGNGGYVWTSLKQLEKDKLILKVGRGKYKVNDRGNRN